VDEEKIQAYAKRFDRVFDYIDRHLSDELSVDSLSQIANFSKFHFHRQFSEYTGINVFRYVQLMRLRRASYRLVFNEEARIIDIALEAGFENPESFSRAFKNIFGQTPSEFRKIPQWQNWSDQYPVVRRERSKPMQVSIVDFKETAIAALEHLGDPRLVNDTVKRFIEWRKQSGLSPITTSRTLGIPYENPDVVAPELFRFDVCGEITEPIPENRQGVVNKIIPGGRCAVTRHLGSRDHIGASIYPLYREWLPTSGEELRDFPVFFHYVNLVPNELEQDMVTDIYLPLR
jgi:AraC family transcriptional regulator